MAKDVLSQESRELLELLERAGKAAETAATPEEAATIIEGFGIDQETAIQLAAHQFGIHKCGIGEVVNS